MISKLVQIPACLLQDSVIPLLEIGELVRLDTSVLDRQARTLFHEQIHGANLVTEPFPIDNQAAKWLLFRNIMISALLVSDNVTDLSIVKRLTAVSFGALVSLDKCNMVCSEEVISFLKLCTETESIRLSHFCFNSRRSIFETIALNCTALQTVDLSGSSNVGIDQLTALTIGCKRLTEIYLNMCNSWMDDTSAAIIAVNCPQLQKLGLNHCSRCRDRTLQVLALHCPHLRYLSLLGLHTLSDEGLRALAAGCAELQTLLVYRNERITTAGIIKLAENCTQLEEIGISECDEHIDQAVAALVQHCPALNSLRCYSSHFTDKTLQHLQKCSLLHTLELIDACISTVGLIQLLDCCINLQYLEVLSRLSCGDFAPVSTGLFANKTFSQLKSIGFLKFTARIDADFITMISQCPNLIRLALQECKQLTDAALLAVAAHCRKLQNIRLAYLSVSDAAFVTLFQGCPDLRFLSIQGCGFLTDTAVRAVAEHCPYLRHLAMPYCIKIGDAGILHILQKCRQLRKLELCRCYLVTHKVLDAILQYGVRLRQVDLRMCAKIEADAATAFRSAKPNCELHS